MKKVIIYGASTGGIRIKQILTNQYKVIAFVDDDKKKIGKKIMDYSVIAADKIMDLNFDYLIIAIPNLNRITLKKHLIDDLHIPLKKIIDYYGNNNQFDIRLGTLRMLAEELYLKNIQGDVAELGVYKGDFAYYINDIFYDKKLYLFDTFEGFDERDIKIDNIYSYSDSNKNEFKNDDYNVVLNKMKYKSNCIIKKGYFPETTNNINTKFCFVNIDVDLYQPTKAGLEYFYPLLSKNGYIMVHDYNSERFLGVKKAVREFCEKNIVNYVPIADTCGSVLLVK